MKLKNPSCLFIVAILFTVFISGCGTAQYEALRKKFVREKKKTIEVPRILAEPVRRQNQEYYKEHFLYWKTWQETLVYNLGGNRKRELQALKESRRHLASLPKYLEDEYSDKLLSHLEEFDKLTEDLEKNPLSDTRSSILARDLDRLGLRIEREFSYSTIKDHMKQGSSRVDLTPYLDTSESNETYGVNENATAGQRGAPAQSGTVNSRENTENGEIIPNKQAPSAEPKIG